MCAGCAWFMHTHIRACVRVCVYTHAPVRIRTRITVHSVHKNTKNVIKDHLRESSLQFLPPLIGTF